MPIICMIKSVVRVNREKKITKRGSIIHICFGEIMTIKISV